MIQQSHSWANIWKRQKLLTQKDTCTPVFTATLCTTTKTQIEPKCPSTDAWIKEMWSVCMYTYTSMCIMDYYSAIKNEIMLFAATWMDQEIIMLGKVSQTEKDKYMIQLFVKSKNYHKWHQTQKDKYYIIYLYVESNRLYITEKYA